MINLEEVAKLREEHAQNGPKRKYEFDRLGLTLELPEELDVHVTDGGTQKDIWGFFVNLIKPNKFEPTDLHYPTKDKMGEGIQKMLKEWKQICPDPTGAYRLFMDFSSKGASVNIVYCYKQVSGAGEIFQRFVEGHEEMHAYTHLLAQEGLVKRHKYCRKKAVQELRGKYPKLAAKIFPYFDTDKNEVIAHCGGIIHNILQGTSKEEAFSRVREVAEKSKKVYPTFQSELEAAATLI